MSSLTNISRIKSEENEPGLSCPSCPWLDSISKLISEFFNSFCQNLFSNSSQSSEPKSDQDTKKQTRTTMKPIVRSPGYREVEKKSSNDLRTEKLLETKIKSVESQLSNLPIEKKIKYYQDLLQLYDIYYKISQEQDVGKEYQNKKNNIKYKIDQLYNIVSNDESELLTEEFSRLLMSLDRQPVSNAALNDLKCEWAKAKISNGNSQVQKQKTDNHIDQNDNTSTEGWNKRSLGESFDGSLGSNASLNNVKGGRAIESEEDDNRSLSKTRSGRGSSISSSPGNAIKNGFRK